MSELLELEPGSIVASQYGLVRQICQYLPGSSLRSCSNVNSLWAKAVDAEGKKRQISMFHWMGEAKSTRVSSSTILYYTHKKSCFLCSIMHSLDYKTLAITNHCTQVSFSTVLFNTHPKNMFNLHEEQRK